MPPVDKTVKANGNDSDGFNDGLLNVIEFSEHFSFSLSLSLCLLSLSIIKIMTSKVIQLKLRIVIIYYLNQSNLIIMK